MSLPGQADWIKLDYVSVAAPPGLRFWDGVSEQFIGSGLVVTAYPLGMGLRRREAVVNDAAVYVLPTLPSRRRFENEVVDEGAGVSARELQVEFYDRQRRFLPGLLRMPERHAGLAGLWCGSPLTQTSFGSPLPGYLSGLEQAIPLFSASSRPVPAGMAVLRAQLWDAEMGRAAAWTLVEVSPPAHGPVMGVADEQGQLTLIFPYPPPQPSSLASPISGPLWLESWTIPLRAYYGALAAPELCAILQQPPAHLWDSLSPALEMSEATLRYGEELILSSDGATRPTTLMITA
jgi:hypothetical protein